MAGLTVERQGKPGRMGAVSDPIPQEHPPQPADNEQVAVARIKEFLGEHPGEGPRAVINYLGRPGARVIVIAADGSHSYTFNYSLPE